MTTATQRKDSNTMDTITELEQKIIVRKAIAEYIAFMDEAAAKYFSTHYPNLTAPNYYIDGGRKYIRIMAPHSVHCFVDALTGDVYMAATINKPALNGARYNLLDEFSFSRLKMKWDPHGSYLYKENAARFPAPDAC